MASPSIHRTTTLLSALQISRPVPPTCRCFSTTRPTPAKSSKNPGQREKAARLAAKQKRKQNPYYKLYDLKQMPQYSLCDAIRYLKAAEVGKNVERIKYEVHVKLKTGRTAAVIRPNTLKLPHPLKTDLKFAVICPIDSKQYRDAKAAGAVLVGEEDIFEELKTGKFDQILAHPKSMMLINKAGLPRILGPKGTMPNPKNGTITTNPAEIINRVQGDAAYRERFGVVRLCVGTLSYTPEMLRSNLTAFIERVKRDASRLGDNTVKQINEVVLSSSNGPGISLNGKFMSIDSPSTAELSV